MKIAVAGSSGLIGSALVTYLRTMGHDVRRFVRREPEAPDEVFWEPERELIDAGVLEGLDVVVHLGGVSIAARRWSASFKEKIRNSRVRSTQLLVEAFGKLSSPPSSFLCASAIGYYGNRGEEILTEDSSPGRGFLASVVEEWENTARTAEKHGIRVVNLRFGQVLARHGGAVSALLPVFRMGLGGPIGSGRAWWSWILLDDVCRAIEFIMLHEGINGPVNITSPCPARNHDFTRALARAVHRPAILPVPPIVLRVLFGQFAEEVLLTSARVIPARLQEKGLTFAFPHIDAALAKVLEKNDNEQTSVI